MTEKHDLHLDLVEKRIPYSLGLMPFIKDDTIISEEEEAQVPPLDRNKLFIDVDVISQNSTSTSMNKTATATSTAKEDALLLLTENNNSTLNETDTGSSMAMNASGTETHTAAKPKIMKPRHINNLLAKKISESFHFFDDKKQKLPKYEAPKKQIPKNSKEQQPNKQNDILSQTISDSFQFLEDNQILPKKTAQKNDQLAETILNSFLSFDFDDKIKKDKKDKKATKQPRPPLVLQNATKTTPSNPYPYIDPSAPLTLADLQQVLNQYGYVRRDEVGTILSSNNPMQSTNETAAGIRKTKSGVAFPQPSMVSNKHLRFGTMISSGFFFLLMSTTIRPNLWLLGAVSGALYGGDLATKAEMMKNAPLPPLPPLEGGGSVYYPPTTRIPGGLYGELSLKMGKKIATAYLHVWDVFQGFWFMYRTGQLSYEYYKSYESVDKRFGIQNKIDAWNARFIEGKDNFDKWEQDNEVGRKVLAGLRTAWMVEETSYKNQMYRKQGSKRSKYRIVQIGNEIIGWYKRLFLLVWGVITRKSNSELREITKGAMMGFNELNLETVSQRLGASVAALVVVNLVGALFAVAPILLGLFAIASGIIWPNWISGAAKIIQELVNEARARGSGKALVKKEKPKERKVKLPVVYRDTFSYYTGRDGKKKWYRTGQSFREGREADVVEERTWNFNFGSLFSSQNR